MYRVSNCLIISDYHSWFLDLLVDSQFPDVPFYKCRKEGQPLHRDLGKGVDWESLWFDLVGIGSSSPSSDGWTIFQSCVRFVVQKK